MYDNKIRLSPDVLKKATVIAEEWGLKNARAAVEAVFRKYSDEYLYGRLCSGTPQGAFQSMNHKCSSQNTYQGFTCPAMSAPVISVPVIPPSLSASSVSLSTEQSANKSSVSQNMSQRLPPETTCEALDALNDLLAL